MMKKYIADSPIVGARASSNRDKRFAPLNQKIRYAPPCISPVPVPPWRKREKLRAAKRIKI